MWSELENPDWATQGKRMQFEFLCHVYDEYDGRMRMQKKNIENYVQFLTT